MNRLVELLSKYTLDSGNFSIEYNRHKLYYYNEPEDVALEYLGREASKKEIEDFLDNVDIHKPIYCVTWYPLTPVGFYTFFSNSIDDLIKDVEETIKRDNLYENSSI